MLNVFCLTKFPVLSERATTVILCTPGSITGMKCCKVTEEYSYVETPSNGPTRVHGESNRTLSIIK